MSLRRRKTTATPSTDKDEYKQIDAFTIEQVMMMMRFEHELAIFAKIVDANFLTFSGDFFA